MGGYGELRTFAVKRALRAVRRWTLLIIALAIATGLAAYGASRVLPKEYVATAQLYIAPGSTQGMSIQDITAGTNVARSFVQLVTTGVVLRPAMSAIGWSDFNSFRDRTTASQLRDTSIVAVSFRDTDPNRAADAANAVAQAFLEQNRTLLSEIQRTAVSRLESQIRALETDIAGLDSQIADLRKVAPVRPGQPTPTPNADLQTQILLLDSARQAKQQTLAQLLKTRDDMDLAAARAEGTVTLYDPATAPDQPVSPRVLLNTVVGTLAGGLVALFIVAAIAYSRVRIGQLEAVEPVLGVVPLGEIPSASRARASAGPLFMRDEVNSAEAEAFRSLRASILSAKIDPTRTVVVVTSARRGEGKSFVAANLALAFAEAGAATVLVDADLRHPTQHLLFRRNRGVGVTSVLTGTLSHEVLASFAAGPRLMVIPAGPPVANPGELLASERMASLLEELADLAGGTFVIVDVSPLLSVADALPLITKADGCLLVVDATRSDVAASRRAVAALRRVNAVVLGVVLNRVSAAEDPYGYETSNARPEKTRPGASLTDARVSRG